jgi:hypothetical protein
VPCAVRAACLTLDRTGLCQHVCRVLILCPVECVVRCHTDPTARVGRGSDLESGIASTVVRRAPRPAPCRKREANAERPNPRRQTCAARCKRFSIVKKAQRHAQATAVYYLLVRLRPWTQTHHASDSRRHPPLPLARGPTPSRAGSDAAPPAYASAGGRAESETESACESETPGPARESSCFCKKSSARPGQWHTSSPKPSDVPIVHRP